MRQVAFGFTVILVTALAARAESGPAKDGREVLVKAAQAAEKMSSIAYRAELFAEGNLAFQIPRLEGKVLAWRHPRTRAGQFRIEATATMMPPPEAAPPSVSSSEEVVFVCDGTEARLLEPNRKVFTSGPSSDAQALQIYSLYSTTDYVSDGPFNDELQGVSVTLEGTQTIDADECDVVSVKYDAGGTRSDKLYFRKKDSLLRRVEKAFPYRMPGRPETLRGLVVFVASAMDLKPQVDESTFTLDCPPGFRKDSFRPEPQQGVGAGQGAAAPDWELKNSEGQTVTLKGLRGKFVVLDFWATWCGPCKMAMPGMQKLHDHFKGKPVAVFGANCYERSPNAKPMDYVKSKNFTYPQLLAADQVALKYGVGGIPHIFVIDPDGKIVFQVRGFDPRAEQQIANIIENGLKK
jgi:thiol-disulfide isomerase/thioredoxin